MYVILGDSLTALSAVDALRTNFTGNIVLIPQSQYGAFENTDIFTKKLGPLSKSELYLCEDDFLDKANVTVIKGNVRWIDIDNKCIEMAGNKERLEFDKLLVAWGAEKKHFKGNFSNVFYLEDKQSHAKVHNELLRAK